MIKTIATVTAIAFALLSAPAVQAKGKGASKSSHVTKNWPSKAPKQGKAAK